MYPKLCSLPPYSEVFFFANVIAHFKHAIRTSTLQEPPNLYPTEYGWYKDEKSLQPVMLPSFKLPTPKYEPDASSGVCARLHHNIICMNINYRNTENQFTPMGAIFLVTSFT